MPLVHGISMGARELCGQVRELVTQPLTAYPGHSKTLVEVMDGTMKVAAVTALTICAISAGSPVLAATIYLSCDFSSVPTSVIGERVVDRHPVSAVVA
jgi:hypothetical protein